MREIALVEQCRLCGSYNNLQRHHIKPLNEGGQDIPENIVFLCKTCHQRMNLHSNRPKENGRISSVGTFYLGPQYWKTWQQFREISLREGTSASQKIIEFITEYVVKHQEGNPQTLIDYAGKPKTLPLFRTCKYGSKSLKINGEFTCQQDHISRTQKICEMRNRNGHCYRGAKP